MASGLARLSPTQVGLVERWLPGAEVVHDHSWGLVETAVLELVRAGARYILKAGGESDRHIAREIHAHEHWLGPWTREGRAPSLAYADPGARLLVTQYLPGELVLGSEYAAQPWTFREAGALLAAFHDQGLVVDHGYEAGENARALAWLAGPHRIAPDIVELLRAEIDSWPTPPATLVPTHGDWQPRNWLVHDGVVRVIDFGRAALRPAMTDLARLAVQDFSRDPELEAAFLEGYGGDPRVTDAWHRTEVREAIGTAAWGHRVGDEGFEAQGLRMIAEVLSRS